jgi:hypothetical protein
MYPDMTAGTSSLSPFRFRDQGRIEGGRQACAPDCCKAIAEGNLAKARGLTNQRLSSRSLKLAAADQYNKGLKVEMRLDS